LVYISAFINTNEFIGETKAEEIEALLLEKLKNLSEVDLKKAYNFLEKYPKPEEKKKVLENMAKSITIECDWEPFFTFVRSHKHINRAFSIKMNIFISRLIVILLEDI